jgi:hypothetical protein
LNHREDKL